jgi:hypothetical protein
LPRREAAPRNDSQGNDRQATPNFRPARVGRRPVRKSQ